MFGNFALSSWLKPVVRSTATLLPDVPCSTTTLPLPFMALPRSSAAILACPTKLEPMKPTKSLHAVPLTVRSIVSTGMCLALAWARDGATPAFSGATISAFAPWAIMFSMSVFCWLMLPLALRWISLMPSFFASAVIDFVSVSRNGLLVDSDCEKPMTALVRSILGAPYLEYVQAAPAVPAALVSTCWAPPVPLPPPPPPPLGLELLVQAEASRAVAMNAPAAMRRAEVLGMSDYSFVAVRVHLRTPGRRERRQACPITRPSMSCFWVIGVSSSTTGHFR